MQIISKPSAVGIAIIWWSLFILAAVMWSWSSLHPPSADWLSSDRWFFKQQLDNKNDFNFSENSNWSDKFKSKIYDFLQRNGSIVENIQQIDLEVQDEWIFSIKNNGSNMDLSNIIQIKKWFPKNYVISYLNVIVDYSHENGNDQRTTNFQYFMKSYLFAVHFMVKVDKILSKAIECFIPFTQVMAQNSKTFENYTLKRQNESEIKLFNELQNIGNDNINQDTQDNSQNLNNGISQNFDIFNAKSIEGLYGRSRRIINDDNIHLKYVVKLFNEQYNPGNLYLLNTNEEFYSII